MASQKKKTFGSKTDKAVAENLESLGSMAPQDADAWLSSFIALAETWPACIVVSDMTIPGAPMVYVNPEFCRVTEYPREEAVGRNCRFLQGPETEPESITVIQETLCKGEDCHVLLTNYRKSGEKFKNLLSMRPVYDADDVYRYTIGVQFEVRKDNSPEKLLQLNKLLQMLPKKLDLRSSKLARDRGMLAANTDGSANAAVLKAGKAEEEPTPKNPKDWAAPIFALTRIQWLLTAEATTRAMVSDGGMGQVLSDFAAEHSSPLTQTHVQFAREAAECLREDLSKSEYSKSLRKLHMRRHHNPMFYCTTTEITYGDLDRMDWAPVKKQVAHDFETTIKFLAEDLLPQLLRSETGRKLVERVRKTEEKQDIGLNTCAFNVSTETSDERYWLDMFSRVACLLDDVGVVVSDMRVPGIPLVSINEPGFKNTTGHGREQLGKSCRFLQCAETEDYLNEEIVVALQECKSLYVKLTNVKKGGEIFQCYFVLHPVFGAEGEYLYQIGCQIDMTGRPSDICRQMKRLETMLQLLPSSTTCRSEEDTARGLMRLTASGEAAAAALPEPVTLKPEPTVTGKTVRTGAGADKDMYGKKMGKTHANALLKMNKSAWLTDADRSLRSLLDRDDGREAFRKFLATEYNDSSLEFWIAAQGLDEMGPDEQSAEAQRLMDTYLGAKDTSGAMGKQDRTKATQKLWKKNAGRQAKSRKDPFKIVTKEAKNIFKMLVVDSFPRFVERGARIHRAFEA